MIPPLGNRAQHADALGNYLRADPIAGEQRNRQLVHTRLVWVDS